MRLPPSHRPGGAIISNAESLASSGPGVDRRSLLANAARRASRSPLVYLVLDFAFALAGAFTLGRMATKLASAVCSQISERIVYV